MSQSKAQRERLVTPPSVVRSGAGATSLEFAADAERLGKFLDEQVPCGTYYRLLLTMLSDQAQHARGLVDGSGRSKAYRAAAELVEAEIKSLRCGG